MKQEDFNQWKGIDAIQIPEGKVITLQLLNIITDPDPENKGRKIIPNQLIRPTCSIFREGKTYNIAAIDTVDMAGNVTFSRIFISGASAGFLRLRSGNPKDERLWKFLSICDENESNSLRNTDVKALFKVVDEEKDSEQVLKDEESVLKAKMLILNYSDADVKKVAKKFEVEGISISDMKSKLLKIAEKKSDAIVSANNELIAVPTKEKSVISDSVQPIKDAIKSGKLRVDKDIKEVYYGDLKVATYNGGKINEAELLATLQEQFPEIVDVLISQE